MKSKLSKSMAICLMLVAMVCLVVTSLLYSPAQKSDDSDKEFVQQETTVTKEVMSEDILADIMDEMTVLEIGKTDYFANIKEDVEKLPQVEEGSAVKVESDKTHDDEAAKEEAKEETKKEEVKKPTIYDTMAISIADTYVNIRESASTDAKIVGKFYKNAVGTITATEGEWYKIESGNAVGYVKAEYVATKDAAKKLYPSVSYKVVKVNADSLNVRKEMSTTSKILTKVKKGESYVLLGQ